MSWEDIKVGLQTLTAILALVTAVFVYLNHRRSELIANKVETIRVEINSRMTQYLEAVRKLSDAKETIAFTAGGDAQRAAENKGPTT